MKRSGTCKEGAGSNLDPSSSGVASRSPFFRCRGMFEQIEGEAGNAVVEGYSFKVVADMLERALIAELSAQLVNIDHDSTTHTGILRILAKPQIDGPEVERTWNRRKYESEDGNRRVSKSRSGG